MTEGSYPACRNVVKTKRVLSVAKTACLLKEWRTSSSYFLLLFKRQSRSRVSSVVVFRVI